MVLSYSLEAEPQTGDGSAVVDLGVVNVNVGDG